MSDTWTEQRQRLETMANHCGDDAIVAALTLIDRQAAALEAAEYSVRAFVDYYEQVGIGDCLEENDDVDADGQFDGDERFNVRLGREALAEIREATNARL